MSKLRVDNISEWLEGNNRYELLVTEYIVKNNIKAMFIAKQLTEDIDKILNEAANKIKKLSKTKSYTELGIGDSATNEAIADEFYKLIY